VFSAELLLTQTEDGIYYRHLNLGEATRLGPDGRALFWNAAGYNANCWNPNGNSITTGACNAGANAPRARFQNNSAFNNVLVAERTGKGSGQNLTLSLNRARQDDPWSWSVAYNYTDADRSQPADLVGGQLQLQRSLGVQPERGSRGPLALRGA
jgi:hypothetical protein